MILNSHHIGIAFACIAALIALSDIKWRKIPNFIVYPFIVALCVINPIAGILGLMLGIVVGVAVYHCGFFGQKIAEGDIKLSMLMSTAFGSIGILSFLSGILFVRIYRDLMSCKKPLPFAPFALAALVIVLIGDHILKAIVS